MCKVIFFYIFFSKTSICDSRGSNSQVHIFKNFSLSTIVNSNNFFIGHRKPHLKWTILTWDRSLHSSFLGKTMLHSFFLTPLSYLFLPISSFTFTLFVLIYLIPDEEHDAVRENICANT